MSELDTFVVADFYLWNAGVTNTINNGWVYRWLGPGMLNPGHDLLEHLNGTEPSIMLLAAAGFFLLWQVKMWESERDL